MMLSTGSYNNKTENCSGCKDLGRKELEKISVGWWKISNSNEDEEAKELKKKRRQSMEQRQQDSCEKRQECGKLRVELKLVELLFRSKKGAYFKLVPPRK